MGVRQTNCKLWCLSFLARSTDEKENDVKAVYQSGGSNIDNSLEMQVLSFCELNRMGFNEQDFFYSNIQILSVFCKITKIIRQFDKVKILRRLYFCALKLVQVALLNRKKIGNPKFAKLMISSVD